MQPVASRWPTLSCLVRVLVVGATRRTEEPDPARRPLPTASSRQPSISRDCDSSSAPANTAATRRAEDLAGAQGLDSANADMFSATSSESCARSRCSAEQRSKKWRTSSRSPPHCKHDAQCSLIGGRAVRARTSNSGRLSTRRRSFNQTPRLQSPFWF